MLASMLKHCEASRGHISRLLRLGCTSASWQTSATEYTVRPEIFSIRATALETSRSLQMCSICRAGTQLAPCKELQVVLTDCYPTILTGFVKLFLFCFVVKHSAHCAHVQSVR